MPRLRANKFLSCFYCGKRTNTRYDGITREFLCLNCDATNHLDENGDITDPPVATEREAPALSASFARSRACSPAVLAPSDNIFCATCLKNQRFFTASLAQYLPDDPNHPDYPELERNYYRYRKGLEQRYPQVCDECAERVEEQIRLAGYTAKTDHLRRMMEKSKGKRSRTDPGRNTAVDWADTLGKSLWWSGLVMQVLWHFSAVSYALEHADDGMLDPDDQGWSAVVTKWLKQAVGYLPAQQRLISGAIAASILSVWWNPQFVQVSRGFTRHLLGFTQWYSFQGVIVFFRFVTRRVLGMDGGRAQSRNAQLSAHAAMAVLMIFIYTLARQSVRIDTTLLFTTTSSRAVRATSPKSQLRSAKKKERDSKTFSELLNEALDTPTSTPQKPSMRRPPQEQNFNPAFSQSFSQAFPATRMGSSSPFRSRQNSPAAAQLKTLQVKNAPTPQRNYRMQGMDEMDWTPTQGQVQPQSQYRAFQDAPASKGPSRRPFGETPTHPDTSAFWYKVPPAPANPARRLRNPPNAPILRSRPAETESFFKKGKDPILRSQRLQKPKPKPQLELELEPLQPQEDEEDEEDHGVTFNQPQFFAPSKGGDEADSLASLLGTSFSLGQGTGQVDSEDEVEEVSGGISAKAKRVSRAAKKIDPNSPRAVETIIVASLLLLWLSTVIVRIPFAREVQLAILSAAGMIALRVTGQDVEKHDGEETPTTGNYIGSILSVVELALVCWLGWEVWAAERQERLGMIGAGTLGLMLGHQGWNTFIM